MPCSHLHSHLNTDQVQLPEPALKEELGLAGWDIASLRWLIYGTEMNGELTFVFLLLSECILLKHLHSYIWFYPSSMSSSNHYIQDILRMPYFYLELIRAITGLMISPIPCLQLLFLYLTTKGHHCHVQSHLLSKRNYNTQILSHP